MEDFVNVFSYDSCAKTVREAVRSFDDFVFLFPLENAHDRAENFLPCNFHVVLNISKDSRSNKKSFFSNSFTSGN